jgi:hypothetical protein
VLARERLGSCTPRTSFVDGDDFLCEPSGLDIDFLRRIRANEDVGLSDIELAVALVRLVHDELERYGTSGGTRVDEREIRGAIRTARSLVERLGLELKLPFSDFGTFRSYWLREDASGSWQARRDILNDLFSDLHDQLERLEDGEIGSALVRPATSRPGTGWARVDTEVNELRRHFQAARTEQDYRNVGNDCVAVLERLSAQVYDAAVHLRDDEEEPPVANTKQRLGRFIEDSAAGPSNAEVRKVARAVIELAQAVKHQGTPTRRDAGIAADSVIQLANISRRLAEDE